MARLNKNTLKLVVVDRDGTLNVYQEGYVQNIDDWKPISGAFEAVAMLNRAGWHVVIATNQPGISRGVLDMSTLNSIHQLMYQQLAQAGGKVDAVFFCPHTADDQCTCRKPLPGMLLDISTRFGVDAAEIHVIGDALRDVEAAQAAGCQPYLVCTGESETYSPAQPPEGLPANTRVFASLQDFAKDLIARTSEPELAI